MSGLLVVMLNPAIDRTLHVPRLQGGQVNRATQAEHRAGGKGLNVVRAAATMGYAATITGPLGGHSGRLLAELTANENLAADWYWLESGETRHCILISHDDTDTTVVNEPGPEVSAQGWLEMAAHIRRLAGRHAAVAFSGSLAPGIDPQAFGALARSLALTERPVYLDTSGEVLALALPNPAGLSIKVNRAELAAGLRQPLNNIDEVSRAGKSLLARGATMVVVTLGSEGALVISAQGCWRAHSPRVEVVSTVGSGDSLLAGFAGALLQGGEITEALKIGVACGAANALDHLPGRFTPEQLKALLAQIEISKLGIKNEELRMKN